MFEIELTDTAQRFYDQAPKPLIKKLDRCFEQLRHNPLRHPNIKALTHALAGRFRYRVGDYRVIYRVDHARRLVSVIAIGHRSEIYDG